MRLGSSGCCMFALAGSSVLSIAQIGVTIGVGLMLDTLMVRTFVLPSLVALLGRWFWWPTRMTTRRARTQTPDSAEYAAGNRQLDDARS
jgi:RND superfamily putative drug exporter